VLLLQEFALEIWDKKDTENVIADHLSRLPIAQGEDGECAFPFDDSFPDKHLLALTTSDAP